MDERLLEAVRNRKLIEFDYRRHRRLAEPHVYGRCRGVEQLLVYQLAGGSESGGLPDWRRIDVDGIGGLTILPQGFAGPRPNPSGRHSFWDRVYAFVDKDASRWGDKTMLELNESAQASLVVREVDTAKHVGLSAADVYPEVLATSKMIAMMEVAAARALNRLLAEGQLSVGVDVRVRHLAATPVGVEVRAVASFLGMEGKLFKFKVEAFDPGGRIGIGEHTRAIIDTARLLEGSRERVNRP